MTLALLPLVAQILQSLGLIVVGSHRKFGWCIGMAAQFTWITFGVITGQHAFLVAAGTAAIQAFHLWTYRHETWRRVPRPGAACTCRCKKHQPTVIYAPMTVRALPTGGAA